jgi:hypothetical protein
MLISENEGPAAGFFHASAQKPGRGHFQRWTSDFVGQCAETKKDFGDYLDFQFLEKHEPST